jgi:hypothetical protein
MTGNRRVGLILQNRDRHLLQELDTMRVVDREQAQVVGGFHSVRRINDRLLALTRAGLLRRIFIGNNTVGQKALYTLSPKGATVVGARLPGLPLRQSRFGTSPFLLHRLAINAFYLTMKYQDLPKPDMRFARWIGFRAPLTTAIPLTPDGYLEIGVGGTMRAMFMEVDLGSESSLVWQKKAQLYVQMAVTGICDQLFRQPQFRVLVIATTERRLRHIRSAIAKFTDKIFWLSTFDEIKQRGFWSSVWLRPTGDQRLTLF